MNKRILVIDDLHNVFFDILKEKNFIIDKAINIEKKILKRKINKYNGLVLRSKINVDKNLIDIACNLEFIARAGAGMENIDFEYAKKKGIKCINSPEGNKNAVAEHTIGMLLCLLNKICISNNEVKNNIWQREKNRGEELEGKTIGIIGYGNNGSAFAKLLSSFDVNIIAYDKYKRNFSNHYVKEVSIEDIMKYSDILSLHIPLTKETKYMVNNEFINSFKKNFILINISRGKIVKTSDLIKNLKTGKITAACLDVLEYEDNDFENIKQNRELKELIENENVIITPHIAGWSRQSYYKISKILAEKILKFYKL